jgi:hypothetical protein
MNVYSDGYAKSNIQYDGNVPIVIRNNIQIHERVFMWSSTTLYTI